MSGSSAVAIEVHGLSAGYGRVPAVRGLDLRVGEGEVVALLGPNGAGKTTTLKTIAGALRPLAGTIDVFGESTAGAPTHRLARRGLGFVPDDRGLFAQLTVRENLRLAGRHPSREATAGALALFPALAGLSDRRCGLLSGGEQQMLAIAKALAAAPRVLMIDELTLGLAPRIAADLYAIVRRLATDRGLAILLVEQHVHMALGIADHVYVLAHGELVLAGTGRDLRAQPDLFTASYFGSEAAG